MPCNARPSRRRLSTARDPSMRGCAAWKTCPDHQMRVQGQGVSVGEGEGEGELTTCSEGKARRWSRSSECMRTNA